MKRYADRGVVSLMVARPVRLGIGVDEGRGSFWLIDDESPTDFKLLTPEIDAIFIRRCWRNWLVDFSYLCYLHYTD